MMRTLRMPLLVCCVPSIVACTAKASATINGPDLYKVGSVTGTVTKSGGGDQEFSPAAVKVQLSTGPSVHASDNGTFRLDSVPIGTASLTMTYEMGTPYNPMFVGPRAMSISVAAGSNTEVGAAPFQFTFVPMTVVADARTEKYPDSPSYQGTFVLDPSQPTRCLQASQSGLTPVYNALIANTTGAIVVDLGASNVLDVNYTPTLRVYECYRSDTQPGISIRLTNTNVVIAASGSAAGPWTPLNKADGSTFTLKNTTLTTARYVRVVGTQTAANYIPPTIVPAMQVVP